MERNQIEELYQKLKYLKEMEDFLIKQNADEKKKWLKIKSPDNEKILVNDKVIKKYLKFVEFQIGKISDELSEV